MIISVKIYFVWTDGAKIYIRHIYLIVKILPWNMKISIRLEINSLSIDVKKEEGHLHTDIMSKAEIFSTNTNLVPYLEVSAYSFRIPNEK